MNSAYRQKCVIPSKTLPFGAVFWLDKDKQLAARASEPDLITLVGLNREKPLLAIHMLGASKRVFFLQSSNKIGKFNQDLIFKHKWMNGIFRKLLNDKRTPNSISAPGLAKKRNQLKKREKRRI